jgi:hypothetical protein
MAFFEQQEEIAFDLFQRNPRLPGQPMIPRAYQVKRLTKQFPADKMFSPHGQSHQCHVDRGILQALEQHRGEPASPALRSLSSPIRRSRCALFENRIVYRRRIRDPDRGGSEPWVREKGTTRRFHSAACPLGRQFTVIRLPATVAVSSPRKLPKVSKASSVLLPEKLFPSGLRRIVSRIITVPSKLPLRSKYQEGCFS